MATNIFKMLNGARVELTEEEVAQSVKDSEAIQAEKDAYDAEAWLRSRVNEYGRWGDQLDEMFHNFDAWKTRIQSIKDKYPKPE